MKTNIEKQDVICSAVNFVRTLTDFYGAEEGQKLWDQIGTVLGKDIKGEMFFAMLTGSYRDRICIKGYCEGSNFITLLRAIRKVCREEMDLSGARKFIEDLSNSTEQRVIKVYPDQYYNACRELTNAGFII